MHYWFKSYSDFAEWVDFAHWWSFIRKGLCLQPAQQACFYVSSVLYYLYFLHCFSSMNQGLKIVVYVRRQTANIHIFQCYLPSYIPNLYTTVENGKYPFNKVNIKFCIFDPLWLSGLYVSLKQQPFKGGDLKCKKIFGDCLLRIQEYGRGLEIQTPEYHGDWKFNCLDIYLPLKQTARRPKSRRRQKSRRQKSRNRQKSPK